MVFFDVLRAKKTLFCPEISVGCVLISANHEDSRGDDALGSNEFPRCCHWFIFATF